MRGWSVRRANQKGRSIRTKDIQSALPLGKPCRSRFGLARVRQVNGEPDELARVISHPLLFQSPDRMFRLFLAPRSEVHLGAASYEMECDVQANTRASNPPNGGCQQPCREKQKG